MNSDKTYFSLLHPGKLSLKEAFGLGKKMGKKRGSTNNLKVTTSILKIRYKRKLQFHKTVSPNPDKKEDKAPQFPWLQTIELVAAN